MTSFETEYQPDRLIYKSISFNKIHKMTLVETEDWVLEKLKIAHPNLDELGIFDESNNSDPDFEKLVELDCRYLMSLTKLPLNMKNLMVLKCSGCSELTHIPDTLINLKYLGLSGCSSITEIPNTLINLQYLNINNCLKIKSIPDTLTKLKKITCVECLNLTYIPKTLVNLEHLDCHGCLKLTKVPSTLEKLTELFCMDSGIYNIPENIEKKLKYFVCWGCKWLKQSMNRSDFENLLRSLVKCQLLLKSWLEKRRMKRIQGRQSIIYEELLSKSLHPDRIGWFFIEMNERYKNDLI